MKSGLYDLLSVKEMIERGDYLILSGDETLLNRLPRGNWIGGTIPYFMAESGGIFSQEKIFVNNATELMSVAEIKVFDESSIDKILTCIPDNGFGLVIIPAKCQTHHSFAINASDYDMFGRPLIGWISGTSLDQLDKVNPKVYNGRDLQVFENGAVAMFVSLPKEQVADIDIINIFEQGEGDTIIFEESGFSVVNAYVNGKYVNFAEYTTQKKLDLRLPLVADYAGAMINVSFQNIEKEEGRVNFYAPVFKGVAYKHAKPVDNYVSQFGSKLPQSGLDNVFFSCNCILNYLFSELEGKKTAGIIGPVTFGEVAYMLLNQTLVYLNIDQID